jgi:DNA-binding FadR family transcriptional regulator
VVEPAAIRGFSIELDPQPAHQILQALSDHQRGVKSEHQQLLEAAIEGRADDAAALLRTHFERTARIIREDPRPFTDV